MANTPFLDEAAGERDTTALVLLASGGIMTGEGIVVIGMKGEIKTTGLTAEGGIWMMTGRRGEGGAARAWRGEGGAGAEERIGRSKI